MKKNTFTRYCYKNLLILIFLIFATKGFGQVGSITTNPDNLFCRDVVNQNSLPCEIKFTFTTGTSGFSLEVLDASGNVVPTPQFNAIIPVNTTSGKFNFIMPSNFRGFGYKFRVKSLSPTSQFVSLPTELNFIGYSSVLAYIPDVTTINFCSGGSFLRINEGVIGIPNLVYRWYKNAILPGNLIAGQSGPTLFIDGITLIAGKYYAEIDYGSCPVIGASSIDVVFGCPCATIISTLGNTITPVQITDLKVTPLSVSPGETYQWYKDNVLIAGATSAIYATNAAGIYKCLVINSSCQGFTAPLTLNVVQQPTSITTGSIPNAVSPNNDNVNDFWELELTDYGINTNTEVTILSAQGETVLKTKEYSNNWPNQNIDFGAINPVYYYIISKQGQDDRKGSITLIK